MHADKSKDGQTNILQYCYAWHFKQVQYLQFNSIQAMTIYKNQMLKEMHTGSSLSNWCFQSVATWKQISWATLADNSIK